MTVHHHDDAVTLLHGDCIEMLRTLPDASVDAVCTDPPYGLEFMGKGWDGADGFRRSLNTADVGRDNAFGRTSRTSPEYRAGALFQEWCEAWARECLRVLKPGGHLLAFGGTRTWHRLACAIEDAGFEMRDSIAWLHGQGFPKGRSQLKPAFEPVVVARKGLRGSMTANVREFGTGSLQVDACRIDARGEKYVTAGGERDDDNAVYGRGLGVSNPQHEAGRWPANVVLDESQAAELDRQSGTLTSGKMRPGVDRATRQGDAYGTFSARTATQTYGDSGGASRFFATFADHAELPGMWEEADLGGGWADNFSTETEGPRFRYVAKAPTKERPKVDGVAHPTVKPLTLMRWLVRLVTPPGGVVLEPFAGSGTTVEAALLEGFRCIAIEREADYLPLIMARLDRTATAPPVEVLPDLGPTVDEKIVEHVATTTRAIGGKGLDAAIAARHADIPQDGLFDVADGDGGTSETQRPSRAVKAAAWGVCPECFTIEATAQILDGDRLVWREHHRTAGRQRLRCRASGTTQSIGEGNSGTREQAQHAATRRVGAGA